jgi:hypothetical protein
MGCASGSRAPYYWYNVGAEMFQLALVGVRDLRVHQALETQQAVLCAARGGGRELGNQGGRPESRPPFIGVGARYRMVQNQSGTLSGFT